MIMQDLESALAEQAPINPETAGMQDLPPLSIDGIPTAVDKMTQVWFFGFYFQQFLSVCYLVHLFIFS